MKKVYLFELYWEAAFSSLKAHPLRSLLSMLGVMFGVGSVMVMLAVGKGARAEILAQIKLFGGNSILVLPVLITDPDPLKPVLSPGLTLEDSKVLAKVLPTLEYVSPEIAMDMSVSHKENRVSSRVIGVEKDYFKILGLKLKKGITFQSFHYQNAAAVCLIDSELEMKLFNGRSALGKHIRCGKQWMKVIGVLNSRSPMATSLGSLGIEYFNLRIYVPIRTALLRFEHKPVIASSTSNTTEKSKEQETTTRPLPIHQLSRITLRTYENEQLLHTSDIIRKILLRRHGQYNDFRILIPEQLIRQRQASQTLLNNLLGIMASISLLIGGIGILNIMLVSVTERTREIGIRRVVGATAQTIRWQFWIEALLICFIGGIAGLFLGILGGNLIQAILKVPVLFDIVSVMAGLLVATGVGLLAGLYPAYQATTVTPIKAIRYE